VEAVVTVEYTGAVERKRVAARIGSSGVFGKPAWYECTKQTEYAFIFLTIA
jgi:hypothetical protein